MGKGIELEDSELTRILMKLTAPDWSERIALSLRDGTRRGL